MTSLHFSRDGILRRSFSRYERSTQTHHHCLVPMAAYERAVDKHAFLKSLHSAIAFEDGLTVGEMMENLAPWAETMIGVGVLDFPAFLTEMRRQPAEKVQEVDQIVLTYTSVLRAVYDSDEPEAGEIFGEPRVTGRVTIVNRWDMEARLSPEHSEDYGGASCIALDYTPMCDWKHLPIRIDQTGQFIDQTASSIDQFHIGTPQPLTDGAHPLINQTKSSHGEVWRHSLPIQSPSPDFFGCLIRGFLWDVGFSYSPVQRDEQMADLKAQIQDIESGAVAPIALDEIDTAILPEPQDDDAEFRLTTAWLNRIVTVCKSSGLPLPIIV